MKVTMPEYLSGLKFLRNEKGDIYYVAWQDEDRAVLWFIKSGKVPWKVAIDRFLQSRRIGLFGHLLDVRQMRERGLYPMRRPKQSAELRKIQKMKMAMMGVGEI